MLCDHYGDMGTSLTVHNVVGLFFGSKEHYSEFHIVIKLLTGIKTGFK